MRNIPSELETEFSKKGDSFFKVVEILYSNHDREFTQADLSKEVGVSQPRISQFTSDLVESDWTVKNEGRTTFGWNTELYNPARTDGTKALSGFYSDLRWVLNKHSQTLPGSFAIAGFIMFVAATVLLVFYIGYLVDASGSDISGITYLVISLGSLIVGVVISLLSPMQAWLHSLYRWVADRER